MVASIEGQFGQGKRLDRLEEAVSRTLAQAAILIERSKRELERSRTLLAA